MKDRDPIDSVEPTTRSRHDRAQSKRRHRAGSHHSEDSAAGPQVIARIPRLERHEEQTPLEKSSGSRQGRLVGARLSAWTLVGGVGFLVVAALLPYVVSKTFQSKSTSEPGTQETAHRPDVPAPNSPSAPRWSGATPASDTWQAASQSITNPMEPPIVAVPATDSSVANASPSRSGQAPSNLLGRPGETSPRQPVPGARSPESLPVGALGSLPTTPARPGPDYYNPPARGGLVNAMPPTYRDNYPIDPQPDYRAAAPIDPRPDYRAAAIDPRPDYRSGTPIESRPEYRAAAPIDPRPDYRTATRPRYGQDAGPSRPDDRRVSYPDYRSDVPVPGYPSREQTAGYEAGPATTMRPPAGPLSASAAGTGPEWISPPNWVSPPNWASPPVSRSPQMAPPAGYSPPSYPATSYSATENWPSGDASAGGLQGVPPPGDYQAARFEGGIERPTTRMSNEYTRPSFR